MKNQKFIELCIKEITGNIEEADRERLTNWLNESDVNRKEYERLKLIWDNTTPEEIPAQIDLENEWKILSNELELDKSKQESESFSGRIGRLVSSLFPPKLKPAAAFSIPIMIAILGWFFFLNNPTEYKLTDVSTSNALTKVVILPDGSEATLNSGSRISYTTPFKEDLRFVELEGEAFFSVTKGDIPFVIKTGNAKVRVLGTEFNVWSREEKTKVIVKNGRVELATITENPAKVELTKDELSEVINNEAPIAPLQVDSDYLLGWMDSELIFEQTPLSEISAELERHYDISLSLQNDNLRDLTLTGAFKNENPDSVLSMICLALDIEYTKEGKNYTIYKQ